MMLPGTELQVLVATSKRLMIDQRRSVRFWLDGWRIGRRR